MTNGKESRLNSSKPEEVGKNLAFLRKKLDSAKLPRKELDRNVIIATWNLRSFGDLTKKWEAEKEDSPKRDFHSLWCIAEIISHFDVIAIQEVKSNLRALRYLLKILGPNWSVIMTDVTKGSRGNDERLAFLFDTRKVQLSGLACELVIPPGKEGKIGEDAFTKQFARTPYAVAFRSKNETFILVTLHVLYGNETERKGELVEIAKWLADWAKEVSVWGHNLICLGDFNIDRKGDKLYDAFVSTGLTTPEDLDKAPRTLTALKYDEPTHKSFYDQIAWFVDKDKPLLTMKYLRSGFFNFVDIALKNRKYNNQELSWRISDHFPLWAEFSTEEDYLL